MKPSSSIEIDVCAADTAVVILGGEHDLASWSDVAVALADACAQCHVLVDLSTCTFLDSSVMTALLVAARQLAERGGALAVVIAPGTQIERIFEVMNVGDLLTQFEDRPKGIAGLSQQRAAREADGDDELRLSA